MRIIRNLTRYSAVLVATSAFGFAACDDDPATNTTDTAQPDTSTGDSSDTSAEPDTSADTAGPGDTTGDTTANPCEPNPCTTAPANKCSSDNLGVVSSAATGTCAAAGATFTCTYTETTTACGADKVCADGACVEGGDVCEYEFADKVSYVTEIALGNQGSGTPAPDDCCFDFTGDGKNDNKLGAILKAASSLAGLNINGTIAEQIASGSLTLLLETKDVSDAANDDNVGLFGFYGDYVGDIDSNTDGIADGVDGLHSFTIDPTSFKPGTNIPLIGFPNSKIVNGKFTAGPNLFQLSIPIVGANLELAISETQVEGDVAVGPNGKGLTMGGNDGKGAKLGGVIKRTDLFKAINVFMKTCTCATIAEDGGDLIGPDNKCNTVDTSACTEDDGSACTQLPTFCGGLIALVQPDVDLDEDGTKDSISIGVWIKATSASIDSVQQCVEAQ